MKTVIIDTREPHEFALSHVKDSMNIPPQRFMSDEIPTELKAVDKDDQLIVYCRSGMRSNTVGHLLRERGFTNIINGVNEHHVAKLLKARA